MDKEQSLQIYNSIEDLLNLARKTNSSMLILFNEKTGEKGRHISAYGSGIEVKQLITDAMKQNKQLREVFNAAFAENN